MDGPSTLEGFSNAFVAFDHELSLHVARVPVPQTSNEQNVVSRWHGLLLNQDCKMRHGIGIVGNDRCAMVSDGPRHTFGLECEMGGDSARRQRFPNGERGLA